jgi:hypothetical protein
MINKKKHADTLQWQHIYSDVIRIIIRKTRASISFVTAYFSPSPLKCCPINRMISTSDLDIFFCGEGLSVSSPLNDPSQVPLCCETDGISTVSPLCCCVVPLVCILTQVLSFFRGGGVRPPLSESDDDASMSALDFRVRICLDVQPRRKIKEKMRHVCTELWSTVQCFPLWRHVHFIGDDGKYRRERLISL